jgi:hypothetical protein
MQASHSPSGRQPSKRFNLRPALIGLTAVALLAALNRLNPAGSSSGETAAPVAAPAPAAAPQAPGEQPLPDQDYMRNPRGAAERVERLARETGGDWNKLSPQDQRMMDSMTAGRGRNAADQGRRLKAAKKDSPSGADPPAPPQPRACIKKQKTSP